MFVDFQATYGPPQTTEICHDSKFFLLVSKCIFFSFFFLFFFSFSFFGDISVVNWLLGCHYLSSKSKDSSTRFDGCGTLFWRSRLWLVFLVLCCGGRGACFKLAPLTDNYEFTCFFLFRMPLNFLKLKNHEPLLSTLSNSFFSHPKTLHHICPNIFHVYHIRKSITVIISIDYSVQTMPPNGKG